MAANKGLGKGLGALLGESAMQPSTQQSPLLLPLQKIEPNRLQPRKSFNEEELASLADRPASGHRLLSDHRGRAKMARRAHGGAPRDPRRHH